MSTLFVMLHFNGNCREALEFYQKCLGGVLSIQSLRDTPKGKELPIEMQQVIVQATLKKAGLTIMGTDLCEDKLLIGNNMQLLLDCADPFELKEYYEKLRMGAMKISPISATHWGAMFGRLTDKFGNKWMFHCALQTNP